MDKSKLYVRVLTTSRCNLNCSECNQREWRNITYDLTPDEVEHFLDVAEQSGYGIEVMSFGAREPTMNPFLPEMIRITKEKGVGFIQILTNGFNIESLDHVKELIDRVYISYYGKVNFDAVRKTKKVFGRKVDVWSIDKHEVIKNEPTAENEPIDCTCYGIALYANKVYACAPVLNLQMRFPKVEPKEYICTDVSLYFLDKLKTLDKGGTKYCYFCAENRNVAKTLKSVPVQRPLETESNCN